MCTVHQIAADEGIRWQEAQRYLEHGNPFDGRGGGKRYPQKGKMYSVKVIAEMENETVSYVRKRLKAGLAVVSRDLKSPSALEIGGINPREIPQLMHWGYLSV